MLLLLRSPLRFFGSYRYYLVFGQPLAQLGSHYLKLDRLCHKVVHALGNEHLLRTAYRVRRERYYRHIVILRHKSAYDVRSLYAVHLRHHVIHEDNVILDLIHKVYRFSRA